MAQQTDSFEFKDENARFGIKDEWINKPLHIGGQKQQTAVEYIIEKLQSTQWEYTPWPERRKIIEQAKQMEKEQIVEAYLQGSFDDGPNQHKSEQYYNETYK